MRSWVLVLSVFGVAGIGAFAACGGEVDPRYGPAEGLRGVGFPDAAPTSTGTTPPPDSGSPPTDGATQGDVVTAACTVSFTQQIYPQMQTAGHWQCATAGCHTGVGASAPPIDGASASAAYNSMKGYTINALPYINSASTDPAKSSIDCNLKGACGAEKMPKAGTGTPATAAELQLLDTWLQCGAPLN